MGWIISIGLLIGSVVYKNEIALIAAGLFAIAGSLSIWLNSISIAIEDKDKKD